MLTSVEAACLPGYPHFSGFSGMRNKVRYVRKETMRLKFIARFFTLTISMDL